MIETSPTHFDALFQICTKNFELIWKKKKTVIDVALPTARLPGPPFVALSVSCFGTLPILDYFDTTLCQTPSCGMDVLLTIWNTMLSTL